MSDAEQARQKAAKIRATGMLRYKEQLLKELEEDKKRKLFVVYVLYFLCVAIIGVLYYTKQQLSLDDILLYLLQD